MASFGSGIAYQSTHQAPPVVTPVQVPNLRVWTVIYSSYINVTLGLDAKALVHSVGTLHLVLGASVWSDSRPYDIAPGQEQAFLFYPSVSVSSVDSVTVQP
jgi:hypothetical protein